jgi:hypothetical protein
VSHRRVTVQDVVNDPDAEGVLAHLAEDFVTAWIPDALAGVDYPALLRQPNAVPDRAATLCVPRAGRAPMRVPVLGFDRLLALHVACDPFRENLDERLHPGVCGYRTGATSSTGYQGEYERFREFVKAGVTEHAWSATADVESFFPSVTAEVILGAVSELSTPLDVDRLAAVLRDFSANGLSALPAGYADARMLGNLVLAAADDVLDVAFTRWVDDYRLFSDDEGALRKALCQISDALRPLGLRLNPRKQRVLQREAAFNEIIGRDLDSVFHPDVESADATRRSLRRVFLEALADPVRNRRTIRFCLPRLASISDDIAIPFATKTLTTTPWDLPRLVHYLSVFRERDGVAESLFDALLTAARSDDHWATARICVGVAGVKLPEAVTDPLALYAERTENAAVWGTVIRVFGMSRDSRTLDATSRALDERASLAALRDLEIDLPRFLVDRAETTARVLKTDPAPPPETFSLL